MRINFTHYAKVLEARQRIGLSVGNIHPHLMKLLEQKKPDQRSNEIIFGRAKENGFSKL